MTLVTDFGDIKIELFCEETPKTCEVFKNCYDLLLIKIYGVLYSGGRGAGCIPCIQHAEVAPR